MKHFLRSISIPVIAAVMLVSCSKNTPKEVATTWLTLFYHMDYEGAKKFSTEDTRNLLALFEEFNGGKNETARAKNDSIKINARKLTITVKHVQQEGDKATVIYSVSDNPKKEEPLYLLKQNDHWLVQFSKRDQQLGAEAAKADQAAAVDSTGGAAPADTTQPDTASRQTESGTTNKD